VENLKLNDLEISAKERLKDAKILCSNGRYDWSVYNGIVYWPLPILLL